MGLAWDVSVQRGGGFMTSVSFRKNLTGIVSNLKVVYRGFAV